MMVECIVCEAKLRLPDDVMEGELITCTECGSDLEIKRIDPLQVAEAPQEEEDWGE